MQVGYARVSTDDQTLALQQDALKQAGCERIFIDIISGAKAERPGLAEALTFLRAADTLVVWAGKLVFHFFGALAEFERELIRERTRAGLIAARARGRQGGRHRALSTKQVEMAQALYDAKKHSIADICKTLRISRATLYRYLQTRIAAVETPSA